MDSLVLRVCAGLLLFVSSQLFAQSNCTYYRVGYTKANGQGGTTGDMTSLSAACADAASGMSGSPPTGDSSTVWTVSGINGLSCSMTGVLTWGKGSGAEGTHVNVTGGAGAQIIEKPCSGSGGTDASCPNSKAKEEAKGMVELGGLTAAQASAFTRNLGSPNGAATCQGGCEVIWKDGGCGSKGGVSTCFTAPPGMPTSKSCGTPGGSSTPTTSTATAAIPNAGKPGYCPGEVNGVTVYVKCDSTTSATSTSTTSTSGTGTATTTGTTTTTSETTCDTPSGQCRTTTTVTSSTSPNGTTTTSTTTTEQPKTDFCKDNPLDKQCKGGNKSTFGGSCAAWTCDSDDAAQCAIAKAVNDSKCLAEEFTKGDDTLKGVGQTAANGGNGTDHPYGSKLNLSVGTFNQANPFGSTCPADQTVGSGPYQVVIPLSSACTIFQMMGNILVAITLLAAARFVVGGTGSGVSA